MYALEFIPNAERLHAAPLLGSTAAVAAAHQMQWLETIRVYGGKPLEALLFFLLSIAASSLILFDRTDRVYLWIGAVFFLTALLQLSVLIGSMTQLIPGSNQLLFDDVLVLPFLLFRMGHGLVSLVSPRSTLLAAKSRRRPHAPLHDFSSHR